MLCIFIALKESLLANSLRVIGVCGKLHFHKLRIYVFCAKKYPGF